MFYLESGVSHLRLVLKRFMSVSTRALDVMSQQELLTRLFRAPICSQAEDIFCFRLICRIEVRF